MAGKNENVNSRRFSVTGGDTAHGLSRRSFLKKTAGIAAGVVGFPYVIQSSALGKSGTVLPSNRVTLGFIGTGNQGKGLLRGFLHRSATQVVALCDVNTLRRKRALDTVEKYYTELAGKSSFKGCAEYNDFRDLLARDDIDAVVIATPDHWHVLIAIAAARAGKDIYLEKPIGVSFAEDQALREAIHCCGTVFQFGTQQRSDARFRMACELVRNGRIGKLHTINVWAPPSYSGGSTKRVPVPKTLDYDMWVGPAPYAPYTKNRCCNVGDPFPDSPFKVWPFISDYCLGWISGWGIHPLDIALWGTDRELSGPVEVEGKGVFPGEGLCDTAIDWNVACRYDSGVTINFTGLLPGEWSRRYGTKQYHGTVFEGTEGWVFVCRGLIDANPRSLLRTPIGPNEVRLYKSNNHIQNFLDCVKSRAETICPVDTAVRSDTICHLSDIATLLERKVKWDPENECFVNDDAANRMLSRPMRSPWHL